MLRKIIRRFVLLVAFAMILPGLQAFAQGAAAKKSQIEVVYKAITESKDVVKTLTSLLKAKDADPDTIASVAAAAGVKIEIVEEAFKVANSGKSSAEIIAAYNKGLSDIVAFTPAAAAGPNAQNQAAQTIDGVSGGFTNGSPVSSFSGGGGGSASKN